MDSILIGYVSFLAKISQPTTVTFLHVVDSGPQTLEIIEQFPEIESKEEFLDLLRADIHEKLDESFDEPEAELRVIIKEGKPTNTIIEVSKSLDFDLLIVGKKTGYVGEGILPKQILKYVATSILFVPENSRYQLENILVPIDFSEQSASATAVASKLAKISGGAVTAQHIYEYKAQFFPYLMSEEEMKRVDQKTEDKKNAFLNSYPIPGNVNISLSRHNKGKLADTVYDKVLNTQADIIIVASKAKRFSALISHDFTDKMVNYAFGVPLLLLRNQKKYQEYLDDLFSD
tara:strand:+ start:2452 stop:3318 length:867 start_codon:yes stop_codon:yes gene_type:complete